MSEYEIIQGDCLEVMRYMPDCTFDSIVTDPPGAIAFMGKDWDSDKGGKAQWIEWMRQVAVECLRVIKPGGHALVWAIPRTSHWTGTAWEDAGWVPREKIYHCFGSGFPKSLDVSKAIDKMSDVDSDMDIRVSQYLKERREELGLSKSDVDNVVFSGSTRYAFVEGRNDATGGGRIYLPTPTEWEKLKQVLGLDDRFDDYILRSVPEREMRYRVDGGKSTLVSTEAGDFGYQKGERWDGQRRVTAPATEAAKQWSGWGTALKPAVEEWWLFRKPLGEKNVAANVLKYGTGALNIDGCRVDSGPSPSVDRRKQKAPGVSIGATGWITPARPDGYNEQHNGEHIGRWPANLILSDEEEVTECFPETGPSNTRPPTGKPLFPTSGKPVEWNANSVMDTTERGVSDNGGSAARFFKQVPIDDETADVKRLYYCAKANSEDRGEGNNHPTVKPVELMRYLVRLVTPPKGRCFDPFAGSGSTGKGAILERFSFTGIEMDADYCEIARARIKQAWDSLYGPGSQTDIFNDLLLK